MELLQSPAPETRGGPLERKRCVLPSVAGEVLQAFLKQEETLSELPIVATVVAGKETHKARFNSIHAARLIALAALRSAQRRSGRACQTAIGALCGRISPAIDLWRPDETGR